MKIDRWMNEFLARDRAVHFNHAGVSPVPARVARAVTQFIEQATVIDAAIHASWTSRAGEVRSRIARLIGARPPEIAFVTNTSAGLSLVAGGLDWRARDNVIAVDGDYPSNIYPWLGLRRFGVDTRLVAQRGGRFGVDDIRGALDSRTRVVSVSAVDWQSGFRADLAALGGFCRERGVLFCVDGIQAVGALAIDVERDSIDCMAVGGHKWLMAPEGCGALFASERIVGQLQPVLLGWHSVEDPDSHLPYHFRLPPNSGRFEPGTLPYLGIHALGAAVELLLEVGTDLVERRVLDITAELADGLRNRGATICSPWGERERSGILTFRLGDPAHLAHALNEHGVVCRARGEGVRLAPHFYNDQDHVARFFNALDGARTAS